MEEWRYIEGYEGKYKVSSIGRVRSIDNYYPIRGGGLQFKKGKILSQRILPNGYVSVSLSQGHKAKTKYVHRLVATAFIKNPFGYTEVNHKDEDKANNIVENLEWCSHLYNINYGNCRKKISSSQTNNPLTGIKVAQYSMDGKLINVYPNANEAGRQTGCDPSSIRKCCNKRPKHLSVRGYLWKDVK